MAETPPASHGDEEPEFADAASLFEDQPSPRVASSSSPATPAIDPGDSYGVEGIDDTEPDDIPPPIPVAPQPKPRPKPKPDVDSSRRSSSGPKATVDRVWTRWDEWGPDLIRLGMVALGVGILVIGSLYFGWWLAALFFLMVGVAGMLVVAYPILITLERPVRMTPEQAVNDYYSALSHLRPHYRRMWLLLSSAGQGSFRTFGNFRSHWEDRQRALRRGRGGTLSVLSFEVLDFRSEKSAGLTELDAQFMVQVTLQGDSEPIASIPVKMGLIKGPDRMWYLNQGTLPAARD